jgi:hypothetical protein
MARALGLLDLGAESYHPADVAETLALYRACDHAGWRAGLTGLKSDDGRKVARLRAERWGRAHGIGPRRPAQRP